MELDKDQHVFFAGIGGVSMSGLAHALLKLGYTVSGSDIADSPTVQALRADGATVHIGHAASNVTGSQVVIRTTAVPDGNPEIVAAKVAGIPIHHRSELLAWMCRGKHGIAISGTHGKSSTTAMTATIFVAVGTDPTVFVGAESPLLGGNFRLGDGDAVIFEACESDGSFVHYVGSSQVITSIEADHLDQHGSIEGVIHAFDCFAAVADREGFIVYNADSPVVTRVAETSPAAHHLSYGLHVPADLQARSVQITAQGSDFELLYHGEKVCDVHLQVMGEHMVSNALAALGCAVGSGLDLCEAAQALATYHTIGRRFEFVAECKGVRIVDDYAHHPTEIQATLAAARKTHEGRLVAVFQPHLRSRTRDLLTEFGQSFRDADLVVLTDIYQPRDDGLEFFDVTHLVDEIRRNEPDKHLELVRDKALLAQVLKELVRPGDLVLTLGAGDIYKVGPQLAELLA